MSERDVFETWWDDASARLMAEGSEWDDSLEWFAWKCWQAALASRPVEPVEGVPIAPAWIKCEERLPEKDGPYIVVRRDLSDGRLYVSIANCVAGSFATYVTHWQPLPTLPTEGE